MSNNTTQIKKYYRPKEASAYLGVALSTIYLYMKQKKLVGKKLSPKVRVFSIEELDSFLKTDDSI